MQLRKSCYIDRILSTMMMFTLVLVALACGVESGIVKRSACGMTSLITGENINKTLDTHNEYRRKETGAGNELKLTWDSDLADRAQEWADGCLWDHGMTTACGSGTRIGQNMYMMGGGSSIPSSYDVEAMITSWAEEKADYHLDDQTCDAVCGHYTQVVWAETMKVGCGIKACPEVKIGSNPAGFTNAYLYVCNYSPGGNVAGQKPFKSGISCSGCSTLATVLGGSTGFMCDEGLCRPCTPEMDGDACECDVKTCQNGGVWNGLQCACECEKGFYGDSCQHTCICSDAVGYESACPQWLGLCSDPKYDAFMTTYCPVSCGKCNLPPSCNA